MLDAALGPASYALENQNPALKMPACGQYQIDIKAFQFLSDFSGFLPVITGPIYTHSPFSYYFQQTSYYPVNHLINAVFRIFWRKHLLNSKNI